MFFLLFTAILSFFGAAHVHAKDSCVDCHKKEDHRILNLRIYTYYKNWKDSVHDRADVQCTDCHRGNSEKSDEKTAHKKLLTFKKGDKKSLKNIPLVCGKCHKEILKNFMTSNHYKELREKKDAPHCVTCHGSMNTGIYSFTAIETACVVCHNDKSRNLPDVAKKAENILHTVNISNAYKGWVFTMYDKESPEMKDLTMRYNDIALSWHTFNFTTLEEETSTFLTDLKSIIKGETAGKRKEKKD
jgi:hypothetical protein